MEYKVNSEKGNLEYGDEHSQQIAVKLGDG